MGTLTNRVLATAAVVCGGSIVLAVWAWWTHFQWERTGAYEHNSFPMNAFARDAAWLAGSLCLASLVGRVVIRSQGGRR